MLIPEEDSPKARKAGSAYVPAVDAHERVVSALLVTADQQRIQAV
jgi:hypothetical protein